MAALAVCAAVPGLVTGRAAADAGDGAVTVRVVRAVDASGVYDPVLEPGMAGVTVDLTDDAGATITGATAADGTVTLNPNGSPLKGGKYRVQVINPKPGLLFSAFASRQGLTGAPRQLSSTEEFVDLSAGKSVSYTTALWNPGDYCQKNAPLVTACVQPPTAGAFARTLVEFPYNARGNNNQTTDRATADQTGAVYGIGWSKQKKWIFSGAHAHRGADYGPGGQGAVYLTDRATGATALFTTVPNAGTTKHDLATAGDANFMGTVAKESLGDVEVSEDGKDLYVVNLNDRRLYRYDATQRTAAAPKAVYTVPDPGCPAAGDWRPYGLGVQDGTVYVGGTCSGESTGSRADLRAVVQTFDPAGGAFTGTVLDQKLDYPRQPTYTLTACQGTGWYTWSDVWRNTQDGKTCSGGLNGYPQPILGDIVVDTDGNMILGFRDRFADQIGVNARMSATDTRLTSVASGGDLNRACPGPDGKFVLDTNGGCGKTGRGNKFYDTQRTVYHYNAAFSGIALSKVETSIASSTMDPTANVYTGGTGFFPRTGVNSDGVGNQLTGSFGKAGSMADLEVLCDEAPLQIGNRVWYDTNKNGIQDPGEPPVPGATVNLYDAAGKLVATTKTTARGEYYFDDTNVPGGLKPRTAYTIRIDDPADYASGGPLFRWVPTVPDAGSNRFVDSKGVVPPGGRFPEYSLTTGGPGENNHTYDFGFHQAEGAVSVLKTDPEGGPLSGAVFQLWQGDPANGGTKVGDPCTTGADGKCTSTVPLGTYYWQETAPPPGFQLPDPAVFGPLELTETNYRTGVSTTAVDQPVRGQVSVAKTGPDGKALSGAVFQLWRGDPANGGTKVGDPCTTGGDGRCSATVLPGSYYWEETKAPAGYQLPKPAVFGPLDLTLANAAAGLTVTAVDQPTVGRVSVLKTDPGGVPLSGAVFQLWRGDPANGGVKVGGPCSTGADGICAAAVGPGSYYWEETQAPVGYQLPEPAVFGPLELTDDNATAGVSATAVDQPTRGRVRVLKADPDGNPLPGAVFQLWKGDPANGGSKVGGPCITGTDGTCSELVGPGSYYWEETQAPAGYQLPKPAVFGPLTITDANAAAGMTVTAVDQPTRGRVSVVKTDPGGAPLAGAVFQLWRGDPANGGVKVGNPCTTGADGLCAAEVGPGSYYWEETKAPAGYQLPKPALFGPLTITDENATGGQSVTAVDRPILGRVSVLKTDPDGKPLSGAVFQLWQGDPANGGTKVGAPCTTGADGTCSVTVRVGTYYWEETQAPAGHHLPDRPVFGPLTLTDENAAAGVSTTAVDQPILGRVSVVKTDPSGRPLAGAVFQLWSGDPANGGTKVGGSCTTGADGTCSATVPPGTYYWEETKAPTGFQLPDPAVFGPLRLTDANAAAGLTVTAVDQPTRGQVSVLKTDPDGKPLAGAVFQLWQGDPANGGTKVGSSCTTAGDGRCSATVTAGTYYWEETKPPTGFQLPDPAVFGPLVLSDENAAAGVSATAVDQPTRGQVSVLKTDPDGKPLAGAEFQLWSGDPANGGTKVGSSCTTAADGRCSATVTVGTYYWQETKPPPGFRLPDPAVFGPLVLSDANAAAGVTLTAVDQPTRGQVSVSKTDPAGKPLAGAVFQLWSGDPANGGTKVGSPCTTGADGVCTAAAGPGTYYWEETKAPEGYRLPDPAVLGPLTLTDANAAAGVSVTVVDQPEEVPTGQVGVTKTDPAGNPLSGAEFQLWSGDPANGGSKVGAPCTTGGDGRCSTVVPLGTYYWQEIRAPHGYQLPDPAVFGPLALTADNHRQGVGTTAVDRPLPGGLRIVKQDRRSHRRLPGAVFELWHRTGEREERLGRACTTGADGSCDFGDRAPGHYLVKETGAPKGYRLPADPVTEVKIRIGGNGQLVLTIDNDRLPELPPTGTEALLAAAAGGTLLLGGGVLHAAVRRRRGA
ncbi:SpaA isopeptide-forming pilin-related protein [Kitasatospora sp. NPDC127059]|uniref:SpaA isopeptide-forming pilin-related protein n=1 Tax=unclassified Kitasatospora TaxID=2633591 RepID=UPI0036675185